MNLFEKNYPLPLLLASTSTYRKNQFATLGYSFIAEAPLIDEEEVKTASSHLSIIDLACKLAKEKALSLQKKYPNHVIIGADQICHLGEISFSKPITHENAQLQLNQLQGKMHTLTTAISIHYQQHHFSHLDQTHLNMRILTHQEITQYIELDKPFYCA